MLSRRSVQQRIRVARSEEDVQLCGHRLALSEAMWGQNAEFFPSCTVIDCLLGGSVGYYKF